VVEQVARDMTYTKMAALKRIAPDSGAYFNECDGNSLDWKRDFFGENYERLLAVKRRYDPGDLWWCRSCVGSDRWVESEEGALCRAHV